MSDRSNRLREKRNSVSEQVAEIKQEDEENGENESDPVKPDKTDKPEEPDKPANTDNDEEEEEEKLKPKEEGEATQMWLPEDVRRELDLRFDEVNLQVQRDGAESLAKLNHWYPLVVQAGLDAIEDMDSEEVRATAEALWD